jgi:hypothetical protein
VDQRDNSTGPERDDAALRLARGRQWLAHEGNGYIPEWDGLRPDEQEQAVIEARRWLRAAYNVGITIVPAGRTVIELPEPNAASSNDQHGSWIVGGDVETDFAAFLHWDDASPVVEVSYERGGTQEWGTAELRTFCLNGLAACEFADRLAAESSQGGTQ